MGGGTGPAAHAAQPHAPPRTPDTAGPGRRKGTGSALRTPLSRLTSKHEQRPRDAHVQAGVCGTSRRAPEGVSESQNAKSSFSLPKTAGLRGVLGAFSLPKLFLDTTLPLGSEAPRIYLGVPGAENICHSKPLRAVGERMRTPGCGVTGADTRRMIWGYRQSPSRGGTDRLHRCSCRDRALSLVPCGSGSSGHGAQ